VAGEPFRRISRQDLDKLMTTLDVTFVRLSECALAAAAHLAVDRTNASTIYCCLRGAGVILLDDETPIRLTPHTLVIVPPGRAMTVAATEHATAPRNTSKYNNGGFTPGASQRHTVGDARPCRTPSRACRTPSASAARLSWRGFPPPSESRRCHCSAG